MPDESTDVAAELRGIRDRLSDPERVDTIISENFPHARAPEPFEIGPPRSPIMPLTSERPSDWLEQVDFEKLGEPFREKVEREQAQLEVTKGTLAALRSSEDYNARMFRVALAGVAVGIAGVVVAIVALIFG